MRCTFSFTSWRRASPRCAEFEVIGGGWVLDRTWYEDAEVFARGLYEQRFMTASGMGSLRSACTASYYTRLRLGRPVCSCISTRPLTTILDRIADRGRPKERDTSVEYWTALHTRYADWIAGFHRCPVLSIDVREYDIIERADDDRGHRDACARRPGGRDPATRAECLTRARILAAVTEMSGRGGDQ